MIIVPRSVTYSVDYWSETHYSIGNNQNYLGSNDILQTKTNTTYT